MPKEIEDLLTQHPGVSQAYAVGVADERWGDVGCAWVVPEPGAEVDAGELLALCRDKLARFKVPRHILFVAADQLPTTPTGKVQKFRLAQRAEEQLAAASAGLSATS
jgi:fatty-acyl-CoA synthase